MQINLELLKILEKGKTIENLYYLTQSRTKSENKELLHILKLMGGRWDRALQAFKFNSPVNPIIEAMFLTNEIENADTLKQLAQLRTPEITANQICDIADLRPNQMILEPSAGNGALIRAMRNKCEKLTIYFYEIDSILFDSVNEADKGICSDFLKAWPKKFDRVLMHPPFDFQLEHVQHALKFIAQNVSDSGKLIAIMSQAVKIRTDAKTTDFKRRLAKWRHEFIDLPEQNFREKKINETVLKVWI